MDNPNATIRLALIAGPLHDPRVEIVTQRITSSHQATINVLDPHLAAIHHYEQSSRDGHTLGHMEIIRNTTWLVGGISRTLLGMHIPVTLGKHLVVVPYFPFRHGQVERLLQQWPQAGVEIHFVDVDDCECPDWTQHREALLQDFLCEARNNGLRLYMHQPENPDHEG